MATSPMQDPQQSPDAGQNPAPQSAPQQQSQAPASPEQIQLAQMYQLLRRLAQTNPVLSSGLGKAAQGIQEAQTALVTQPQQQPSTQNPPY